MNTLKEAVEAMREKIDDYVEVWPSSALNPVPFCILHPTSQAYMCMYHPTIAQVATSDDATADKAAADKAMNALLRRKSSLKHTAFKVSVHPSARFLPHTT